MPEEMNIIVSSLPEYVEQNRDQLIRRVVLQTRTITHMVPQLGIKTKAAVNYLDVDPKFQDGRGCKYTPQEGGIVLTQREIETGIIKVEFDICPDTLLGKYAEFLVKIHATEQEYPFERFILEDTIDRINYKLEKAIWQGDTDSDNEDLNKFDGLLKLASEEGDTIIVEFEESDSVWNKLKAVILALPDEALESGRTAVFIGTDLFRNFMLEVVEKNFFHYDGVHNEAPQEFVFPGTNTVVVSTPGLSRTGILYATYEKNLYYGCDMLDAKEEIFVKWDDLNGLFHTKVKWNSGVQTAFPDLVVVGSAGTPAPVQVVISGATSVAMAAGAGSKAETYAASDGKGVKATVPAAASWLSAVVNGNIVTFTAAANSGAARSAVVRISTATEGATGYLDVTITQAAPAEAPTISGAATLNVANTAGSNNRTYATSDGSAVVATVPEEAAGWLSTSVEDNVVTFTHTAQEAAAAQRSAVVHLSTATGGSKDVTVTQAAG